MSKIGYFMAGIGTGFFAAKAACFIYGYMKERDLLASEVPGGKECATLMKNYTRIVEYEPGHHKEVTYKAA